MKTFMNDSPIGIAVLSFAHGHAHAYCERISTFDDARVLAAWEKVSQKKLPADVAKIAFGTIVYTTEAKTTDLQRFADIAFKTGALKRKADLSGFVFGEK